MSLLRRPAGGGTFDGLVVGLGNPGPQYARTRHNAGFMVVDRLAERAGASFRKKYNGRFTEATLADSRIALLEPQTFMNLSGRSAAAAARFYKLPASLVIVVFDESELAFGRVRARSGGGLKGHNGLRSMAEALGTADFLRVRCGVGRPGHGDRRDVADYVLAPFAPEEDPTHLIDLAADCVEEILRNGIDAAEQAYLTP